MRDLVPWQRNALLGAVVGLVIPVAAYLFMFAVAAVSPRSGTFGLSLLFLLTPSNGVVTYMGQLPRWGALTALSIINSLICSIIWAGIRSSGRWKWLFRAGVVLLYLALLASSNHGLSRAVEGP